MRLEQVYLPDDELAIDEHQTPETLHSLDELHQLDVENGYPMEMTPLRVELLRRLASATDPGQRARAIIELNNNTHKQRAAKS